MSPRVAVATAPCVLALFVSTAVAQPAKVFEEDALAKAEAAAMKVEAARIKAMHKAIDADIAIKVVDDEIMKLGMLQPVKIGKDGPVKIGRDSPERGPKPGCRVDDIRDDDDAESAYRCGRQALDRAEWDEALRAFTLVSSAKQTPKAVGAYYWRAYSQNRLGQRAEALASLGELKRAYPTSAWLAEANALEVQIRQSTGQAVSPDSAADDDLKLLALQGLAASDSETAVPMIENLLKGAHPPRLKERALFVLAHSNKPAARDVVVRVAKGGGNPDLQLKAVEFVGMMRTPESGRMLSEIYGTSQDPALRRAILRGYGMAQDRERLVAAARQETSPELRLEAVRQLGMMKAGAELAELYTKETSPEVRKQILRGLAVSEQTDRLAALAQTEPDPELRRTAIRSLGLKRDPATAQLLMSLYAKEQAKEVRSAIIDALYTQSNAAALVTLARQEKDPELKRTLVGRLSTMRSKEATDYLMELLK
jgi:HEAT repeat protein